MRRMMAWLLALLMIGGTALAEQAFSNGAMMEEVTVAFVGEVDRESEIAGEVADEAQESDTAGEVPSWMRGVALSGDASQDAPAGDQLPSWMRGVALPGGASGGAPVAMALTDIGIDGMVVARCAAPPEYQVDYGVECCTRAQSATYPWQMTITARSPEGVELFYASTRDYVADIGDDSNDGAYNVEAHTPMLHYMQAPEYCDYLARRFSADGTNLKLARQQAFPQAQPHMQQAAQLAYDLTNARTAETGISFQWTEITLVKRRYTFDLGAQRYVLCVVAGTRGSQVNAYVPGFPRPVGRSYIAWDAPFVYALRCPEALWDENSALLDLFMENTTVTDQFIEANRRLSQELVSIYAGRDDLTGARDYCRQALAEAAGDGSDYSEERFSDYIFDQNDYTLSDGSHVKAPSMYDYVYEGDDRNVYVSTSAFSEGERLVANR